MGPCNHTYMWMCALFHTLEGPSSGGGPREGSNATPSLADLLNEPALFSELKLVLG